MAVPDGTVARLAETLDRESGDYCDIPKQSIALPFGVIAATKHALIVALSGDPRDAGAAADFARDDVARAVHAHGGLNDPDAADQEELRWQIGWLHHVGATEPETARSGFAAHTVTKPTWYLRWEN
ncbi:hypothetical protein AMK27_36035 [Streptomyces sp. CB02009]|uniref:hypothetical protein n=1 Tax=Streptomyces sp. CB02009 TaxID=1703938 RepID=UPI00093E9B36|nr:hypothetical protein [Streptomyces sp. CB02009]OKJ49487.1 hypothetical protein AMK27_36035 [Streptomyces sp. CB02009]